MADKLPPTHLHVVYHPAENFVSIVNTNGLQLLAISNPHRAVSEDAMAAIGHACAAIIQQSPRVDLYGERFRQRPDPDVAKEGGS